MATTFSSYRTTIVSSAAARKPDATRKTASQANKWWAPLFGLSSEPDYITIQSSSTKDQDLSGRARSDRNIFRGGFTEEKAKELRKKTIETSTFHDIMYHSAIAARLASDVSGRSDR